MNDRQRLEAIIRVIGQYLPPDGTPINDAMSEIISLVDPLPKQEQGEPVAWTLDSLEQEIYANTRTFVSLNVMEWLLTRLNTTPQQRTWVGLTEQEQGAIMESLNAYGTNLYHFANALEAKLKEKNT